MHPASWPGADGISCTGDSYRMRNAVEFEAISTCCQQTVKAGAIIDHQSISFSHKSPNRN